MPTKLAAHTWCLLTKGHHLQPSNLSAAHLPYIHLFETRRSRRDAAAWSGRSDTNKRVVFDDVMMQALAIQSKTSPSPSPSPSLVSADVGSYVAVRIDSSNGITLCGCKNQNPFLQPRSRIFFSHEHAHLQLLLACCLRELL